jgi:CheY-like chemotaxis protein
VIDDEEMLLRIVRRMLEIEAHELLCVGSAREALAVLEKGEQFDIILCDMMMPNMTGMKLYEVLLREHPDQVSRIIFMTGGATTAREDDFLRSIPNVLLGKPFTPKSLLEAVHQFLAAQKSIERVHHGS